MDASPFLLALLFFMTAAVYSAAGFGGGSSYLAILSFALSDFQEMRTVALLCNLVVVSGSVWFFWGKRLIRPSRLFPLVAVSVPAAFLAAQVQLTQDTFFVCLGATLVGAAVAMGLQKKPDIEPDQKAGRWKEFSVGGGIGFLSGLVGIGGGIFLSPLLHLLRWDSAKRIAAAASVFILVNSMAGVAGLLASGQFQFRGPQTIGLLVAVFIGGQCGVRFCVSQVAASRIRVITAMLVLAAGLRILWSALV